MAKSDTTTLEMLKKIDRKLDAVLDSLSETKGSEGPSKSGSLAARARDIAALTPPAVRQTDAVELLHEDRSR